MATSLGVLALITGGGALFAAFTGSLNMAVTAPFAIAALGGLLLGQLLNKKMDGSKIQLVFAILTVLVAGSLLLKGMKELNGF